MASDDLSPREKFQKLAEKRVPAALKKIDLVGNLAGPRYKYTQREADKIVMHLELAVAMVKKRFNS